MNIAIINLIFNCHNPFQIFHPVAILSRKVKPAYVPEGGTHAFLFFAPSVNVTLDEQLDSSSTLLFLLQSGFSMQIRKQ
ncbi:MAG: hypothetical protein WC889_11410 [Myxococcota bacterium]|jgi:hypothetical protein